MWRKLLEAVGEERERFGLGPVNPGAPAEALSSWADRVREVLGVRPPREWLDILAQVDGLEWNGFILYGADREFFAPPGEVYGLIEQNEIWYEVDSQRAYLFLGESNISWYVYQIKTGRYLELDNPSGEEMEAFPSCEALLEKLLRDCLL